MWCCSVISLFLLYIPYGSDKTLDDAGSVMAELSFISHMVQIKLEAAGLKAYMNIFISHMVQIKLEEVAKFYALNFLYIPYGSDKTIRPKRSIDI